MLTGGIHTNIFKIRDYQINIVFNDKQSMMMAKDMLIESGYVESVAMKDKVVTSAQHFRKKKEF